MLVRVRFSKIFNDESTIVVNDWACCLTKDGCWNFKRLFDMIQSGKYCMFFCQLEGIKCEAQSQ